MRQRTRVQLTIRLRPASTYAFLPDFSRSRTLGSCEVGGGIYGTVVEYKQFVTVPKNIDTRPTTQPESSYFCPVYDLGSRHTVNPLSCEDKVMDAISQCPPAGVVDHVLEEVPLRLTFESALATAVVLFARVDMMEHVYHRNHGERPFRQSVLHRSMFERSFALRG